jgi:hypothetical protein
MAERWLATVLTLRPSRSAIWWLVWPAASRSRTSRSRALSSRERGWGGRWAGEVGEQPGGDAGAEDGLAGGHGGDGPGELAGGLDAVELGHLQVHDHHVGPVQDGLADGGLAGGGLGHDLHLRRRGRGRLQPGPDQGVVVGDQDPDGHGSASGRLAWTRPPVGVGPT